MPKWYVSTWLHNNTSIGRCFFGDFSYRIYPMVSQTVEWYTSITFPVALQYKWKSVIDKKIVNLNSLHIEDNWDFKQNVLTWSSSGITFLKKKISNNSFDTFSSPSFSVDHQIQSILWVQTRVTGACKNLPLVQFSLVIRGLIIFDSLAQYAYLLMEISLFHVVSQASELSRIHYSKNTA